jgi:hypothetical protein
MFSLINFNYQHSRLDDVSMNLHNGTQYRKLESNGDAMTTTSFWRCSSKAFSHMWGGAHDNREH